MARLEREVLVCYDVSSTKARTKLFNALKDIGLQAIQESVFWGRLRPAEERSLAREFEKLLDKSTDRALLIPVSLEDSVRVVAFGHGPDPFRMPTVTVVT